MWMMTFKRHKRLMMVIVLAAILCAWYWRHHMSMRGAEMPVVTVSAMTVKESSVPVEIQVIGSLSAERVDITPEIAGHVSQILVQDGSQVKKGQPIIQLDDAIYKAKLASSKAQLGYSESNYKRMVLLGKQGAVAKQAIDAADADLKQRRAEALENEVMVNKMQMTAPFEVHLPQLKMGQDVTIISNTYQGKIFTGKVAFISPEINALSRSIQLYAEIANEDHALAPGMFVTIRQALGEEAHAMMVPARSAMAVMDGQQIYKVVDGKAVPVNVKLGMRKQDMVEVTDGLTAGDVIVTDGQIKLRSGSPVKVLS
jgi:membrane fusion protein (multidrug efflux system)